jgi:C4-type Zn-finger protein
MRIVKRGNWPADVLYQGSCPSCGSVVEAQTAELTLSRPKKDEPQTGKANCPVCGGEMLFTVKES